MKHAKVGYKFKNLKPES